MHELSIVQSMIALIKQQLPNDPPKPAKRLVVRVGMMSCVQPEALQACFDTVKCQDKQVQSCELSILKTHPSADCPHCNNRFELHRIGQPCECGNFDYKVTGGDDLTLAELEF